MGEPWLLLLYVTACSHWKAAFDYFPLLIEARIDYYGLWKTPRLRWAGGLKERIGLSLAGLRHKKNPLLRVCTVPLLELLGG